MQLNLLMFQKKKQNKLKPHRKEDIEKRIFVFGTYIKGGKLVFKDSVRFIRTLLGHHLSELNSKSKGRIIT